jgi:ribosomal 50S subunit-recycling heat shock protein
MRIDQFLQKVGIVKRRSLAKQLCDNGAVAVNDRKVKPAQDVSANDTVVVKFRNKKASYKVLQIPSGSVRKDARDDYVKLIAEEYFHEDL